MHWLSRLSMPFQATQIIVPGGFNLEHMCCSHYLCSFLSYPLTLARKRSMSVWWFYCLCDPPHMPYVTELCTLMMWPSLGCCATRMDHCRHSILRVPCMHDRTASDSFLPEHVPHNQQNALSHCTCDLHSTPLFFWENSIVFVKAL